MYQSIMISEFEQLIKKNNINILDVREEEEFVDGHIEEAILLPLSQIQENVEQLDKNQQYHVICRSGGRSQMACQFLSEQGFNVINIIGGMSDFKGNVVTDKHQ